MYIEMVSGRYGGGGGSFRTNKGLVSIVFNLNNEDKPSIYCNNLWFQVVSVIENITTFISLWILQALSVLYIYIIY